MLLNCTHIHFIYYYYFFLFLSRSCLSFSLPVGGSSRFRPSRVGGRGTNVLLVLSLPPPLCIIALVAAPITSSSLGWAVGLPAAIAGCCCCSRDYACETGSRPPHLGGRGAEVPSHRQQQHML